MNKALEDLQAGRDPFAPSPDDSKSEFYQNLAKWSKWLTILAAALYFVVSRSLPDAPPGDQGRRYVLLGLAVVCGLMLLTSLVLGIIALCAVPKYGSEDILKPALRGVIVSLLVIAGFGYGYNKSS